MIDFNTGSGVLTIAKFHNNHDSESPNKVISRTLGKFGIISLGYKGVQPKDDEFWLVRIINNIRPKERQGCLILEPVKKIDYYKEVGKLVNGMYEEIPSGNELIAFIKPKKKFENYIWQLPLTDRKKYNDRYVIVIQSESLLKNEVEDAGNKNAEESQQGTNA